MTDIFEGRLLLKSLIATFAILVGFTSKAQDYLSREITINEGSRQRVGDLLEKIGNNQGFYFSYNSDALDADRMVTLAGYRGPLVHLLETTLGEGYEFKETPGYVIIRYAPGTMDLAIHLEKERGRALVVEGQVKDAHTHEGIHSASIYERNVLVSTLSGPAGNFKLIIKRPDETVWLTISKKNYRDTTIALLPPVQVRSAQKRRHYRFYPNDFIGEGLEGTAIGRFFTSSKQRIQRINLGGFFAYSPYQVSLTPGLSSQGLFNSQVVNQVSLNVIGGHTAGVNGVEVGGVFNINQTNVRHVQVAGLFNVVGSNVNGVQLAGASNVVMQDISGVQVAGVHNRTRSVNGTQLSGVVNVADDIRGMQVAAVANVASRVKGVQLAVLVNVADSSDFPIGLVNLVRTGSKSLTAGLDESGMAQLTFRSGGRVLYGLVGAGYYVNGHPMSYGLEAGLGVHVLQAGAFGLDGEVGHRTSTDFRKDSESRLSLRLLPRLHLGRHWGATGGPTVSYAYSHNQRGASNELRLGIYGGLLYRW